MKPLLLGLLGIQLASLSGSQLLAQTISGSNISPPAGGLFDASPSPSPDPDKKKDAQPGQNAQGPTVIDSDNMDYDEKTRIAIFTGDYYGVFVKDPQFTINCDKLTAYMRKAPAPSLAAQKGKPPAATPAPTPKGATAAASASASAAASKGNGLSRAVCEGGPDRPVVIVQDKPASGTDQAQHNVGIAKKADYNADTGDVVLTGWPRVSQGTNTQIATSEKTIMIMNKDGHTMKTFGPSRSTFQQQDQPKKSDDDSKSDKSDKDSTPSAQ